MMTKEEVLKELESYGDEKTKAIFLKHGAREPYFGVKVQDLKKIQKKIKKDHDLSIELFATGNSDAMYLAGLIADENKITKEDLNRWADEAYWYMISEYTVAWIASESPHGLELGLDWIESPEERIASAGWATLSYHASLKPDDDLEMDLYLKLLDRVARNVHNSANRVRYTMNGFVIATGTYVQHLTRQAIATAQTIGKVDVIQGGAGCKVPLATAYLQKVIDKGKVGKKRKTARC